MNRRDFFQRLASAAVAVFCVSTSATTVRARGPRTTTHSYTGSISTTTLSTMTRPYCSSLTYKDGDGDRHHDDVHYFGNHNSICACGKAARRPPWSKTIA